MGQRRQAFQSQGGLRCVGCLSSSFEGIPWHLQLKMKVAKRQALPAGEVTRGAIDEKCAADRFAKVNPDYDYNALHFINNGVHGRTASKC